MAPTWAAALSWVTYPNQVALRSISSSTWISNDDPDDCRLPFDGVEGRDSRAARWERKWVMNFQKFDAPRNQRKPRVDP
ncbi:hypothetical protein NMY22_g6893 [Coprinellus aureogranulatus]|nr:hypothetical protein NMY22_g6893 [Coprinellus aureogranulatus]